MPPVVPPSHEDDVYKLSGCDEPELVLAWRLERILRVGCPLKYAGPIAEGRADLHVILTALEHGCKPSVAHRIFV